MLRADGTQLEPVHAAVVTRYAVPSNTEAKRIVANTRRRLADLPALPHQMNTIGAVLLYTCSGLADEEISVATGLTVEQIDRIRTTPAYSVAQEHVINAVRNEASTEVTAILAKAKVKAANKLVDILDSSDIEQNVIKVATDVLDRTGHNAKQNVEVNVMGGLRWEIVDKRNSAVPTIDSFATEGEM